MRVRGMWLYLRALIAEAKLIIQCHREGHQWDKWEQKERNGIVYWTRRCPRCWRRTWLFPDGDGGFSL